MKTRRVCIAACLAICLIGSNISGTFGMSETIDQTEQIPNEEDEMSGKAESPTPNIIDPGNSDEDGTAPTPDFQPDGSGSSAGDVNPDNSSPDVSPDSPDNSAPDVSPDNPDNSAPDVSPDNPDNSPGDVKPGNPDNSSGDVKPGNPDNSSGDVKPGNPDNSSGDVKPDIPDNSAPDSKPGDAGTTSPPASDSVDDNMSDQPDSLPADAPESTESSGDIPAAGRDDIIYDTNPDAVYRGGYFNKSGAFLDTRDKTKHNVAIPIEGLPSFVTQEMVVAALKSQDETGFPASVTMAQIIQESGFGVYGPDGENGQGLSYLAYQYNNLFGIKGIGPAGSVNMSTGEQTEDGETYMTSANFRVYNTYTECIEDRTQLLMEVYSDLTAGVTDANTFAMNIGARWATDIRYGQSLIHQMETYDLYRLDRMTLVQFSEMIGTFANPCPGAALTSSFGYREFRNSYHQGIDLGTGFFHLPTYAADAGTVITAGWNDSAGNWIVIDHGDGLVTKYMHHDTIYVTEGEHVEKGQQLGLSGTTGDSTGNHLHFQVEENSVAVDPAPYLGFTE